MKILLTLLSALLFAGPVSAQNSPIESLKAWLASPFEERSDIESETFATTALTKVQADQAADLLWNDHVNRLREQQQDDWENKVVRHGDIEMKFDFKTFGDKPEDGRSLYISMHGGGGAPAEVNEQQWRNQIRLYVPEEGVYLAPRAPTNTWNLWHQSHIDKLFAQLIQNAVQFEDVNPNKVYLMGYSAGGDGVYQLAPRMADYWAAAAMMAGHPNDASPLGLRNIGFTLHMGGDDSAYNRNKVAEQWKKTLAELQESDPDGYQHEVVIHEGLGHWMQRKDQVAVPWMAEFRRNPTPQKIVWRQSGVTHDQFYWLAVDEENKKGHTEIVVSRGDDGVFTVEKADGVSAFMILLRDDFADLEEAIRIKLPDQDKIMEVSAKRTIASLHRTLSRRGDQDFMFPAEIEVSLE